MEKGRLPCRRDRRGPGDGSSRRVGDVRGARDQQHNVTEPTHNSRTTRQNGLVNVNIEDLFLQLPVAVAANICDVDVVVLASEILLNDASACTASAGAAGIG
jgi:hypothetical protein